MCLDTKCTKKDFTIKKHPKNPKLKIGYKVVVQRRNKDIQSGNGMTPIPFKVACWINEAKVRSRDEQNTKAIEFGCGIGKYPVGFHVFVDKESAKQFAFLYRTSIPSKLGGRIIKVYFKRAITYGLQYNLPIIITDEIYIPHQIPLGATSGHPCKIRI